MRPKSQGKSGVESAVGQLTKKRGRKYPHFLLTRVTRWPPAPHLQPRRQGTGIVGQCIRPARHRSGGGTTTTYEPELCVVTHPSHARGSRMAPTDTTSGQGLGFGSHAQRSCCRLPCSCTPRAWDLGTPCSWTAALGCRILTRLLRRRFRRWPRRECTMSTEAGSGPALRWSTGCRSWIPRWCAALGEPERAYEIGTLTRTTVSGLSSSRRERPFGRVYWRERPFGRVDSSYAWGCRQSRHRELAQGPPG